MLSFESGHRGKRLGGFEPVCVAGEGSGHEWPGEPLRDLGTEPARDESVHALTQGATRPDEGFPQQPELAAQRQKAGSDEGAG